MCYTSITMSLFHKTESFVGVDIGAYGIKVVELKKKEQRPQLWTYGMADANLDIHVLVQKPVTQIGADDRPRPPAMAPTPAAAVKQEITSVERERIDRYAALLKQVLTAARVETTRAVASIPVSQVFHTVITLPPVNPKELEHHVNAKVKKMLPHPIEEMQVVHQQIPNAAGEEAKDMKLLVTAAPKKLVYFYTAIFERAGLHLEELETEAFAVERSLVGRDPATAMVVDIGSHQTNFFIIDRGMPLTHRSLQVGGRQLDELLARYLGLEPALVGQVKHDLSHTTMEGVPADLFMAVADPMIKEIQYSFDLFLHQTGNEGKRPEKIILTGGSAVFPPLVSLLQQSFGSMKVFVGDPWARVVYQQGLKSVLDRLGPRMSVAIGLALRNVLA